MASRWRLAGELATVGVLAAATTVGLTATRGEAPRVAAATSAAPGSAAPGSAGVLDPADAEVETLPLPALPVVRWVAAASSGRSVGHSAWRSALHEPAVRGIADIPARALEAYQRAATVIDLADESCHLDWPLLAAIAKVESDHGRFSGATVADDGRVRPFILGPRLTGLDHTRRMPDTDAGLLDGDRHVDRALGPFQIVPSTWSQVRVDADGDGRRDPNDVDDAALAASVFLCSGRGDLATTDGQRHAVRRYNSDGGYARLVLHVMADYEAAAETGLVVLVRTAGDAAVPTVPGLPGMPDPTATGPSDDASFVDADSPGWTGTTMTTTPAAPSPTALPTPTQSATPTPAPSPSASVSGTPTAAPTTSAPPTESTSPTASASPTASDSPTASPEADPDPALSPGDGTEGPGLSVATGLSLTAPAGAPLWWVLRRRRRRTPERG